MQGHVQPEKFTHGKLQHNEKSGLQKAIKQEISDRNNTFAEEL